MKNITVVQAPGGGSIKRYTITLTLDDGTIEELWVRVHFNHWLPRRLPGGPRWEIVIGRDVYASGLTLPAETFAEAVQHARQFQRYGRRLGPKLRYLAMAWYYLRDLVMLIPYAMNWAEREGKAWAAANVRFFRDVPWNDSQVPA